MEHKARARLLRGLAVEERRIEVNGIGTTVLEGGDGPPLLLLHGGIECGGIYWAPVISRLAQDHRLIVPDAPGLGESEPDREGFTGWMSALLRLTCEEPPTLVAHSLLGTLALRFAADHGERLRRLVIYAAPGVGPYRMPIGLRAVAIRFALRPSEANMVRFERWAFADLDRVRRLDPDWLDAFTAYTRSRALVPHVKRTMRQLVATGTKQVRERIDVPTTLLWGAQDRFVPLDLATTASKRLGWPLRVIDDAGHVPHIEQPDAFVHALEEATRTQS
ncbi:alpha/beta fold hydrolase [Kribbella sp. NBC_00359]|uniref:alpha/beta fold hydrolase n=1 Tax=Kribbella sp. NBC_00359 TaxID=2975966 RepID=UPI002E22101C